MPLPVYVKLDLTSITLLIPESHMDQEIHLPHILHTGANRFVLLQWESNQITIIGLKKNSIPKKFESFKGEHQQICSIHRVTEAGKPYWFIHSSRISTECSTVSRAYQVETKKKQGRVNFSFALDENHFPHRVKAKRAYQLNLLQIAYNKHVKKYGGVALHHGKFIELGEAK